MPVIDFKEIPQANIADGNQDRFELFAREFFVALGFKIIEDPDRGQDGGRDIIISEKRIGIISHTDKRWLVSCKHKAHSGSSVLVSDEEDLSDRIQGHNCTGFIGFYSTIVSAPLKRKFDSIVQQNNYEIQIFDNEKIERILLENSVAYKLIKRFFPKSYNKMESKTPSNILSKYEALRCKVCGRDLLHRDVLDKYVGIVVFVEDMDYFSENGGKNKYTEVYCVCKGQCDVKMERIPRNYKYITEWNDISDLVIPTEFLKFVIAIMNRIREKADIYTDDAYEGLKNIIILLAQIAMKEQTLEDVERIIALSQLPEGL